MIGKRDGVGLGFLPDLLPLIEAVHRHKAAAALEPDWQGIAFSLDPAAYGE